MSWGTRNVTVVLGGRAALDDVSVDVPDGQVTAVVGGDGAGKTTLLRVLAGVQPATGGEVRRPDQRRIGYLSSRSGTYADLSVDENLAFAATAYGVAPTEARRRAADLLDRTGLAPFGDRLAGHLSGGMRQKLGVIQALIHRPDLVVLDEPTTGIDPVSRVELWWLMARAAADDAAVVLATTYLDEAERCAGVLALDAGRTLAVGTPAEIVAAVPGTVVSQAERPTGPDRQRAWRRRSAWRVWQPDGAPGPDGGGPAPDAERVETDLQDAVTVFALDRELRAGADANLGGSLGGSGW